MICHEEYEKFIQDPKGSHHVTILYENQEQLNALVAEYINEGLKRGQLCVYATVHFRDEEHVDRLASLITDYRDNVEKGNLLIVDLAPYYICSLLGDFEPFEEAKRLFSEIAKGKADRHVRFVGDATGFLFKNKHFEECAIIEKWWQKKPFEGSYLCPFPKPFFNSFPHGIYSKRAVVANHDTVLDISENGTQDMPVSEVAASGKPSTEIATND